MNVPVLAGPLFVNFAIETGSRVSVLMPADYTADGVTSPNLSEFPPISIGLGAGRAGRAVPAILMLADQDGTAHRVNVAMAVAPSSAATHGRASFLGTDILDRFRLTVDRSTGLVALTDAQGDLTSERWPDGEPRE